MKVKSQNSKFKKRQGPGCLKNINRNGAKDAREKFYCPLRPGVLAVNPKEIIMICEQPQTRHPATIRKGVLKARRDVTSGPVSR
jgi:hypothetical protein